MGIVNTKMKDIYERGSMDMYREVMDVLNRITANESNRPVPKNMTIGDVSYEISIALHKALGFETVDETQSG